MSKNKILLSALILSFGFFVSSVVFAQNTTSTYAPYAPTNAQVDASGISFPIPELGNCGSKDACRSYCDQPGNMPACISFAKAHGLMNRDDADRAQKYVEEINNKQTPGGCTGPESCNAYCQNITHLDECISFAEKHGLSDDNIKQGEQIKNYLAQGGKMPGGCTSKDACEAYCSDFSHSKECTAFAKGAGFLKKIAEDQGLSEEQLQTVVDLTANGQGPGGCKSKDQCESYCQDQSHLTECVDFGVKAGFMTRDQADKIKKIGGKGPGGCNSETACKAYCSDPAHREECFKFGEENGLIPPEELKAAKEGIVQLKVGLENAPPEIKACLNSVLGPDKIAQIQAGTFVPGPDIGDQIRQCADKFQKSFNAGDAFKGAPPEVAKCLKEKLGDSADKVISGQTMPDAAMADAFRVCMSLNQIMQGVPGEQRDGFSECGITPGAVAVYVCGINGKGAPAGVETTYFNKCHAKQQDAQILHEGACGNKKQECPDVADPVCGNDNNSWTSPCGAEKHGGVKHKGVCTREDFAGLRGPGGGQSVPNADQFLKNAPVEVQSCIKEKLGADFADKLAKGEAQADDIQGKMKDCFKNFMPQPPRGQGSGEGEKSGPGYAPPGAATAVPLMPGGIPPVMLDCVKSKLSAEEFAKLSQGQFSSDAKDALQSCAYKVMPGIPPMPQQGNPRPTDLYPSYPSGSSTPPSGSYSPGSYGPPPGSISPGGYSPTAGSIPGGNYTSSSGGFVPPAGVLPSIPNAGSYGLPTGSSPPGNYVPPLNSTPPPGYIPPGNYTPPAGTTPTSGSYPPPTGTTSPSR